MCSSDLEMTGGSKAVFILLGLLASLVAAGTLVEVLLSTRLISSFLLREKYDSDSDKDRVTHLLASEAETKALYRCQIVYTTQTEKIPRFLVEQRSTHSLLSDR